VTSVDPHSAKMVLMAVWANWSMDTSAQQKLGQKIHKQDDPSMEKRSDVASHTTGSFRCFSFVNITERPRPKYAPNMCSTTDPACRQTLS